MSEIKIFKKGIDYIFEDVYVNYYLLCKFDKDKVIKSYSFAYAPYIDSYFDIKDYHLLNNILTLEDANNYIISIKPDYYIENNDNLYKLIDNEFLLEWDLFHRSEYKYIFSDTESDDNEDFIWKNIG